MHASRRGSWHWLWLVAPLAWLAGIGGVDGQTAVEPAPRTTAKSPDGEPGAKWVRLVRDKRQLPLAMETAIVRYVPRADYDPALRPKEYDQYVDLVGAVHIGDRAYYDKLNRRFREYDAVLYELVAPEGTVVPRGHGTDSSHPLGALQNGMKGMLEVEHQLECIDYTRANFVHADMSPEEFLKSMEDRQEGFLQMYFKLLGASLAAQNSADPADSPEADFFAAIFASDRPRRLKIAMAKQFETMEELLVSLAGPDGSTLITERNRRALDVLEKQLQGDARRLAIFYGAGHLAHMHEQMAERFDMRPVGVEWVEAWNLRPEP